MDQKKKPDGVIKAGAKSIRWSVPDGAVPWQLGLKSRWPILGKFLDVSGAKDFYVNDEASERSLAEVQKLFNTSHDSVRWGVVHVFVGNAGGDNAELLKRLLALGIDPDLDERDGWKPSHLCGAWAREDCAKVISMCRPSLTAKDDEGTTPRDAATLTYEDSPYLPPELRESEKELRRPRVLKVWDELEKSGFPSLARMASERQWWAVKNLSRRRLVPRDEILEKYGGKTAVEWALAFGETQLAQELRYLFRGVLWEEQVKGCIHALSTKVNEIEKLVGRLRGDLKKVSDSRATSVPTADADARAKAAKQQSVVAEYLSQLRTELTELREGMQEEKKKVTDKLKAVEADVQKIKRRSPQSADSIKSARGSSTGNASHLGNRRRKQTTSGGDADTLRIASSVAIRVRRAAETSSEFVGRVFDLLDEYQIAGHE